MQDIARKLVELSTILNAVFSIQFSNVECRKAEPQKYIGFYRQQILFVLWNC